MIKVLVDKNKYDISNLKIFSNNISSYLIFMPKKRKTYSLNINSNSKEIFYYFYQYRLIEPNTIFNHPIYHIDDITYRCSCSKIHFKKFKCPLHKI